MRKQNWFDRTASDSVLQRSQTVVPGMLVAAIVTGVRAHGLILRLVRVTDFDGHDHNPDLEDPEALFALALLV